MVAESGDAAAEVEEVRRKWDRRNWACGLASGEGRAFKVTHQGLGGFGIGVDAESNCWRRLEKLQLSKYFHQK